jgi:glycyl-tRNA synthetase beta subunit
MVRSVTCLSNPQLQTRQINKMPVKSHHLKKVFLICRGIDLHTDKVTQRSEKIMEEKKQDNLENNMLSDEELQQVSAGFSEEAGWKRTNTKCKSRSCDGEIWVQSGKFDGKTVRVYICDRCMTMEHR